MDSEKGKVLVVDDEAGVRDLLQRILEGAGYNAVTAANGQEALAKMSQLDVKIVLLDIKMPGMSGIDVLKEITINWPETCVVMATALADAQTAVEAMKLGAYDYITKPFTRDNVLLKLQGAIEKRNLQQENEHHQHFLEEKVSEQAQRLQDQFVELVETLAREHKLIYKLASNQKDGRSVLSKFPKELQEPMSSVEEFSEALIRVLRRGTLKPGVPAIQGMAKPQNYS